MSCQRCGTPLEDGDIRCPVCAFPSPARAQGQAAVMRVLRCPDCNAALAYSAERQNPVCAFCGAVMKVEEPVDPVEKPEARVRLAVGPEAAKAALKRWLSTRGFFRPGNLAADSTVDALHPLWWAGWACDAQATVSWTADSDAGARRSKWAPHSGKESLEWKNLLVSASRGLSLDETWALSGHYDLGPQEPIPADGAGVEQFDLQRSAARRTVVEAIERDAAARLQQRSIPGSTFRNVHVNALLVGLTTRRLALPAWVMAYRFKNKLYRAVVHGQNEQVVIGTSPISWARVLLVVLGGAALIALIVFVILQLK